MNDNEKKKKRATERYLAEKEVKKDLSEKLSTLNKQIENLEKDKKRIRMKKTALMKYHKYLDKFKNNNNDGENYSDIKEILDRFDTLKKEEKNLKGLNEDQEKELKESKTLKNEFSKT